MIERQFARYRRQVVPLWTYLVAPYGQGGAIPIGLRGLYIVSTDKSMCAVWRAR